MSKSNKELAVDVAIAYINSRPLQVRNNNSDTTPVDLKSALNVITSVNDLLDKIDQENGTSD